MGKRRKGRCVNGGFFIVSLERNYIKIEMSSYGRTRPIIVRLPTAGFKTADPKEVLLIHEGDYLTAVARSGGLYYARRAEVAVLPYLNCGVHVGNSEWLDGFSGTMTRVEMLRCVPQDFVNF